jgi:superoxide oxidase
MTESTQKFSPMLRRLHWLMAVLIVLVYLAMEQRGLFARGTAARTAMVQSHFWLGLAVFALALWRVTHRWRSGAPPIAPPLPRWQQAIGRLMHFSLYVFFIVMPVLGIATAWTDEKTLYVPFTDIALPALLAPNEALAHSLEDLHKTIGKVFYFVIGFHVLAALYHHFVRRDDTLRRMA